MDIEYYKKYEPFFGKWYISKKLGSGAFGCVFEIERKEIDETFKAALKVISIPSNEDEIEEMAKTENITFDEAYSFYYDQVMNYKSEILLMSRLKGNSNIVSYEDHDIIERENKSGWDILIRMELLTPLNEYIKQNPMKEERVLQLGIDICNALEICQKKGIIHRDIKPGNIFVSNTGDFKIGDFGIAKMSDTTRFNTIAGSPGYQAPEIYTNITGYDRRVDIYSLGMVMFRLLNRNRLPFLPLPPNQPTFKESEMAEIRRRKGEMLPNPKDASKKVSNIIRTACEPNPQNRYYSATEMKTALKEAIESINGDSRKSKDSGSADNPPGDSDGPTQYGGASDEPAKKYSPQAKPPETPNPPRDKNNDKLQVRVILYIALSVFLIAISVTIVFVVYSRLHELKGFDNTAISDTYEAEKVYDSSGDKYVSKEETEAVSEDTESIDKTATVNEYDIEKESIGGESDYEATGEEWLRAQSDVILVGDNTEVVLIVGSSAWIAGAEKLEWSSSDPKIAKVEHGVVEGINSGDVIITAKYQNNTYTCPLHVSNVDYGVGAKIDVDYKSISIDRSSIDVTISLLGNTPEKFGIKCYASHELGLMLPQWGDIDGNKITLTIMPSMSVSSGEGDMTIIVYPQDDPHHIVSSEKIHIKQN